MCARLLVFVVCAFCIESLEPCIAPSGRNGTCTSIPDCPSVYILNTTGTYRDATNSCGNNMTKICCEESAFCYTSDWQQGICVSVFECPTVTHILKSLSSNDIATFLTNSRCKGPELLSICCGPRPPNVAPPDVDCEPTTPPLDPRTGCCGKHDSTRVFESNQTALDQYPWLALIEYKKQNKLKLLCGGSLISGRYVLTAGHCVAGHALRSGEPVNVRLGEYDLSNDGPDCIIIGRDKRCTEGTKVIAIEIIIIHPEYNARRTASRHDIALLRLIESAPYSDFIRPICLPTQDHTLNLYDGFKLWAAGWGAIDGIRRNKIRLDFDLPFKSLESCQPEYRTSKINALWRGQLCAGGIKNKDTCKGDSGGPLMYEANGVFEIIGIVSFGPKFCGTENIPGVYTKVYEYLPWIRAHIRP